MGNITKKSKPQGRRSRFRKQHVEKCLDELNLGSEQRQLVESPGTTKLEHYAKLLTKANYVAWTAFALAHSTEIVKQSAEGPGKPVLPSDPIKSLVLKIPESVKHKLEQAIESRIGFDGDLSSAVKRLLKDAEQGSKSH